VSTVSPFTLPAPADNLTKKLCNENSPSFSCTDIFTTIRADEIATLYIITAGRNNHKYKIDEEENPRNWLHPVDTVNVTNTDGDGKEQQWRYFTDGRKSEQGAGSGVALFTGRILTNNSNSS